MASILLPAAQHVNGSQCHQIPTAYLNRRELSGLGSVRERIPFFEPLAQHEAANKLHKLQVEPLHGRGENG